MKLILHYLATGFTALMMFGFIVATGFCIRVALNSDGAWRSSLLIFGGIGAAVVALCGGILYWLWH
jgi:hypothetical protein